MKSLLAISCTDYAARMRKLRAMKNVNDLLNLCVLALSRIANPAHCANISFLIMGAASDYKEHKAAPRGSLVAHVREFGPGGDSLISARPSAAFSNSTAPALG
jgi:hypothetical protein